jgi:nicotinamidase-related amidase
MQRDFCDRGGYAAKAGLDVGRLSSVINKIHTLLDVARQAGLLVIHTREGICLTYRTAIPQSYCAANWRVRLSAKKSRWEGC